MKRILLGVLVLSLAVPVLTFAFNRIVAERMGTIILSAFVAHTAWHWMLERGATLSRYRIEWPEIDAAFALALVRAFMLLLIIVGLGWALSAGVKRLAGRVAVGEVRAE